MKNKYETLYSELMGHGVGFDTEIEDAFPIVSPMLAYVGMLRNPELAETLRTFINAGWAYELVDMSYVDDAGRRVLNAQIHSLEEGVEDVELFWEDSEDYFYDLLIAEAAFAAAEQAHSFREDLEELKDKLAGETED